MTDPTDLADGTSLPILGEEEVREVREVLGAMGEEWEALGAMGEEEQQQP